MIYGPGELGAKVTEQEDLVPLEATRRHWPLSGPKVPLAGLAVKVRVPDGATLPPVLVTVPVHVVAGVAEPKVMEPGEQLTDIESE